MVGYVGHILPYILEHKRHGQSVHASRSVSKVGSGLAGTSAGLVSMVLVGCLSKPAERLRSLEPIPGQPWPIYDGVAILTVVAAKMTVSNRI